MKAIFRLVFWVLSGAELLEAGWMIGEMMYEGGKKGLTVWLDYGTRFSSVTSYKRRYVNFNNFL